MLSNIGNWSILEVQDDNHAHSHPNFIGELQEHLQQLAPLLGARPEELYRIEEDHVRNNCFRARVILRNVREGGERCMRWSPLCSKMKRARQAAAQVALEDLVKEQLHPHDPTTRLVVVHTQAQRTSTRSGNLPLSYATVASLPVGYDEVFPNAVMLWSEVRKRYNDVDELSDASSSLEEEDLVQDTSGETMPEEMPGGGGSDVPVNLGK